ncbi:fatty acid hydroxylase [Methyloceanibacter methanicus]|uniref:Fatty acid hydroxylase n=1 Tax=Methyloceanibacter methanicus TaxID=1774968 RepID=A0A1E3W4J0_9HYPH|nr:sterol desaturase family protein [Methyloceanibacter methanicus]ODS00057.1 fatty acid hydroxylase [Methyloceanibacter methanicus]
MQGPFSFDDTMVRLGVFAGLFILFALIERLLPRRRLIASKGRRWLTNLGIGATASVLLRLMAALAVPLTAFAAAFYAQHNGLGLLNAVDWPAWIKVVIALAVLDLAIWAQHLASHKIPVLWRLHQVHHADRDIDVTTAIRFHPVEIGLSMLWKMAVVIPLGASPLAVFLFEVILNGCAMFNHANIDLPRPLDRLLRLAIVTPDMHRVHHSVYRTEHDSNYGFNLSIWDRLFRTYTAQPKDGHLGMRIGLTSYQTTAPTRFGWSLWLPFQMRQGSPNRPAEDAPNAKTEA